MAKINFGPPADQAAIPSSPTQYDPNYEDNQFLGRVQTKGQDAEFESIMQALDNNPISAIGRAIEKRSQELGGKDLVDPDEFNRQHPYLQDPLTQPTPRALAEELARRAEEKQRSDDIIARGPGGLYWGLRGFVANSVITALDPINLAAGVATGGILGAAAEGASIYGRVGHRLIEGAIGAIPGEVITGTQARAEGQDYGFGDFAKNTVYGAAGYAALFEGVPFVGRTLKGGFDALHERVLGGRIGAAAEETAIRQLESGKKVEVQPLMDQVHRETSGEIVANPERPPVDPGYRFEKIDQANGKSFFAASERSLEHFQESPKAPIGDPILGDAIYLTDNPNVANGAAARQLSETDGKVFKVGVAKDANLLDLDRPLEGKALEQFRSLIEEIDPENAKEILKSEDAMQVIGRIRDGIRSGSSPNLAQHDVITALQVAGYDGVHYQGGGGVEYPHNVVALFDHENTGDAGGKLVQEGEFAPSREAVPQPSPEDLKAIADERISHKSDLLFDDDLYKQVQDLIDEPHPDLDLPRLEEQETQALENLQTLDKQGLLDPEMKADVEKVQEMAKKSATVESMSKIGMTCIGKDI
jgi:hypothetical protein